MLDEVCRDAAPLSQRSLRESLGPYPLALHLNPLAPLPSVRIRWSSGAVVVFPNSLVLSLPFAVVRWAFCPFRFLHHSTFGVVRCPFGLDPLAPKYGIATRRRGRKESGKMGKPKGVRTGRRENGRMEERCAALSLPLTRVRCHPRRLRIHTRGTKAARTHSGGRMKARRANGACNSASPSYCRS